MYIDSAKNKQVKRKTTTQYIQTHTHTISTYTEGPLLEYVKNNVKTNAILVLYRKEEQKSFFNRIYREICVCKKRVCK